MLEEEHKAGEEAEEKVGCFRASDTECICHSTYRCGHESYIPRQKRVKISPDPRLSPSLVCYRSMRSRSGEYWVRPSLEASSSGWISPVRAQKWTDPHAPLPAG